MTSAEHITLLTQLLHKLESLTQISLITLFFALSIPVFALIGFALLSQAKYQSGATAWLAGVALAVFVWTPAQSSDTDLALTVGSVLHKLPPQYLAKKWGNEEGKVSRYQVSQNVIAMSMGLEQAIAAMKEDLAREEFKTSPQYDAEKARALSKASPKAPGAFKESLQVADRTPH